MPTKKATEKKTTKADPKHTAKVVEKSVNVEPKKSHIEVEKKNVETCSCGADCNCGCKGKCCLKTIIFILILLNLVLAAIICCKNISRNAWTIETAKVGGKENMAKAEELYKSNFYVENQTSSIDAYLAQHTQEVIDLEGQTEEESGEEVLD